jgi:hypothetical protein
MPRQKLALLPFTILVVILLAVRGTMGGNPQPPETANQDKPYPIYAENPNDAWNRIFHSLFSRRVKTRYSNEFPERGPFRPPSEYLSPSPALRKVSTRVFEHFESGDRAIDPLYPIDPAYPSPYIGARQVLDGPLYTELTEALREALSDSSERSALARALMQSDLWSAFDILRAYPLEGLEEHRRILLNMLAHLMKKIALTPANVDSLPDNYTLAIGKSGLPDLFTSGAGWMEVQWFPDREHDAAAGFRRVARAFVKPARSPKDTQKFLNSLRNTDGQELLEALDGVAIVIQLILIDAEGKLLPSPITSDVQLRLFAKTPDGQFKATEVRQYELSRGILLSQAGSGGFVLETDSAPAYLPAAGNDYDFASRHPLRARAAGVDPPILVKLRTRCASCHSMDLTLIFTFEMKPDPTVPVPRVRQLNPASHEAADHVISRKIAEDSWKALRQYFSSPSPG